MQWCLKKIASGVGARLNRNLYKPKKEKEKKKIKVKTTGLLLLFCQHTVILLKSCVQS